MPGAADDLIELVAPMQATVSAIKVADGDRVGAGSTVMLLESMKMEHPVDAPTAGVVDRVVVAAGDRVEAHQVLAVLTPGGGAEATGAAETDGLAHAADAADPYRAVGEAEAPDLDHIRADLAEAQYRHARGLDDFRPEAVARRRDKGHRTARENIAHLCDPGTFTEYGALAIAAQRRRRDLDDLIDNTPADGLITGFGSVDNDNLGDEVARCAIAAYDDTVLAGTQGALNHKKLDRLLGLVARWHTPLVLFAEGGGGRPGDVDAMGVAGLDTPSFQRFAALSGQVPLVGIVAGRCFAGNAALLGCCDVIIATEDASIGMGGPAMIEGGGLGRHHPDEVGPTSVQAPNGVIDVLVADEAEAAEVAKTYLGYVRGATGDGTCADQRHLRHLVPENRRRSYDVRAVIEALADTGSVLELRCAFAPGMVTALVRIEGRPFGLIANDSHHLGGAIDADGADKAARFCQLCDASGLPVVSLCDTPGFMVGPEAEATATVRHVSRMFVVAGAMTVPVFTVVLRKGYGLGAQAMAAGSFHATGFTIAWPSGEFGGMGLEGAVRLGYRKELEAIADPGERAAREQELIERAYEVGRATNMASYVEIDAVIDPAETRRWLTEGARTAGDRPLRAPVGHRFIDPW